MGQRMPLVAGLRQEQSEVGALGSMQETRCEEPWGYAREDLREFWGVQARSGGQCWDAASDALLDSVVARRVESQQRACR